MNKKLLVVMTTALVLGMAACGKTVHPSEGYTVLGNFMVGEVTNGWGDKSTEVFDQTLMTKLDVNKLTGDAATLLAGKPVSEVYKISNVNLGTTDSSWSTNAMKDGVKVSCNGSYAIKAGYATYDAEDGIWAIQQWIPDPSTGHVESLTAGTFFVPSWTEAADANGFSWADNSVCIGGPGAYTVYVAKYTTSAGEDSFNYGMGLVLDESKTSDYGAYTEVTEFVPADHTFGLVGTITSWGTDPDIAMVANEDNTAWSASYTFAADDSWKIRYDSAWNIPDWGFGAIVSQPEGAFVDDGGNIKCVTAGEYTITLANFATDGSAEITIEAAAVDPEALVTSIQADTNYKFGLDHQNLATPDIYYATGALDGYYAATTNVPADGADFMLVAVTGGYSVKVTLADDSVLYMNLVVSGDHTNIKFEVAASSVWTIDTTNNTIVTAVTGHTTATKDGTFFIGTSSTKTFTTFSCVLIDYVSTNYVARFYNVTVA